MADRESPVATKVKPFDISELKKIPKRYKKSRDQAVRENRERVRNAERDSVFKDLKKKKRS